MHLSMCMCECERYTQLLCILLLLELVFFMSVSLSRPSLANVAKALLRPPPLLQGEHISAIARSYADLLGSLQFAVTRTIDQLAGCCVACCIAGRS